MQSVSFAGHDKLDATDHTKKKPAAQHLSTLVIPESKSEAPRLKIQGEPDQDTFEPGEKSLPHPPSFKVTDHSAESPTENLKRKLEEVDFDSDDNPLLRTPTLVLQTPVDDDEEKGLIEKKLDADSQEALSPGRPWEHVEKNAVRGGDTKYLWQKGTAQLHSPHDDKSDPENIKDIVAKKRREIPQKWTDLLKALKADQEAKKDKKDPES